MISPQRGEVWLVCFDPTIGAEIQKTRRAVVVSVNSVGKLPLRIVVPVTGWDIKYENMPWIVRIPKTDSNSLIKDSAADCYQVKSVSLQRFSRKLGNLSSAKLDEVCAAIQLCIGAI